MTDSDRSLDPREVRADGREVRADGREGRADVREVSASRRDDRAEGREGNAQGRERRAVGREGVTNKLVRLLVFLTTVLCVLATVSIIRSFVVQDAVEKVEGIEAQSALTGAETNEVSRETLAELRKALKDIEERRESGSGTSPAVAEALQAIARMEAHMCGGPCPPP